MSRAILGCVAAKLPAHSEFQSIHWVIPPINVFNLVQYWTSILVQYFHEFRRQFQCCAHFGQTCVKCVVALHSTIQRSGAAIAICDATTTALHGMASKWTRLLLEQQFGGHLTRGKFRFCDLQRPKLRKNANIVIERWKAKWMTFLLVPNFWCGQTFLKSSANWMLSASVNADNNVTWVRRRRPRGMDNPTWLSSSTSI